MAFKILCTVSGDRQAKGHGALLHGDEYGPFETREEAERNAEEMRREAEALGLLGVQYTVKSA